MTLADLLCNDAATALLSMTPRLWVLGCAGLALMVLAVAMRRRA